MLRRLWFATEFSEYRALPLSCVFYACPKPQEKGSSFVFCCFSALAACLHEMVELRKRVIATVVLSPTDVASQEALQGWAQMTQSLRSISRTSKFNIIVISSSSVALSQSSNNSGEGQSNRENRKKNRATFRDAGILSKCVPYK